MDSCSRSSSSTTSTFCSSTSSSSGFVQRPVKTAKFVLTGIRYSRHQGLNPGVVLYRVFDVPEGRNDGVVAHHRLLMATVVAIITSLVLTSTNSALWQQAQQIRVDSDCEGYELFVCPQMCHGLYNVTYRGGKPTNVDFSRNCTSDYGTNQRINGAERLGNSIVCERITGERWCSEHKPKKLKVWSEALPEATCAWCIFLWIITYLFLYMDCQYIQRLIYYLLVTSEAMAVCSLLVRPFLIYMIPDFITCVITICFLVFGLALVLVYADHYNHQDHNHLN